MPAYANPLLPQDRKLQSRPLMLVLLAHGLVLALALTAKMTLDRPQVYGTTEVDLIPIEPDPPEVPPEPRTEPRAEPGVRPLRPEPMQPVPLDPPLGGLELPTGPADTLGPAPGTGLQADPLPQPKADPVRRGPRFATPATMLRPPYPPLKLEREEEAVLRLRLSIDERGRVVAIDPVGPADRIFLDAARRHLLARWRYEPATVDGVPVPSSTVITLQFRLED
jgi:periplasmic protein TonB